MNRTALKLLMVLLAFLPLAADAQDLTGIWRGYFITESGETYRLEFQVQQSKSNMVKGVSYSYLDQRFYGKATMTGNFVKKNGAFSIQELKTVEVRNLGGGSTCLMNYKFTFSRSGREQFLEGTYLGKSENRLDPKKNGKWGDCGGGRVYLRKVTTSDFYIEPFLRNRVTAPVSDSVKNKPAATPPARPANPSGTRPQVTRPADKPKNEIQKPEAPKTSVPLERRERDTLQVRPSLPVAERHSEPKKIPVPEQTRSRKNELVQTIVVNSEEITIRLYDNGEIDDDTVSLYLNGQLVLANKRLSTTPIIYTVKLDENSPEQTLIMVAENMGRIPPNTSLMIVQDGNKRYQVNITSTEQKNAMVRFRYQKSPN